MLLYMGRNVKDLIFRKEFMINYTGVLILLGWDPNSFSLLFSIELYCSMKKKLIQKSCLESIIENEKAKSGFGLEVLLN